MSGSTLHTNDTLNPSRSIEPKISIITISLNSASTIRQTIESVLSQNYKNIEYILVDGQSTDGTLQIIQKYQHDFPEKIKWVSEPDFGLYDAMNKGIRLATGEIVGILNSDDCYSNSQCVSQIAHAFQNKCIQAVFADLRIVAQNDINRTFRYYSSSRFHPNRFKFGFMPAHPTFFTYMKNFNEYGYYKNNYVIAADYELLVRFLYVHRLPYEYLPIDLIRMRKGGRSTASIRQKLKFDSEIVRACKSNGLYTNSLIVLFRGVEKFSEFLFRN